MFLFDHGRSHGHWSTGLSLGWLRSNVGVIPRGSIVVKMLGHASRVLDVFSGAGQLLLDIHSLDRSRSHVCVDT